MEKEFKPIKLHCKVEDFIPQVQDSTSYVMAKPVGVENTSLVIPDSVKKQLDIRYTIVTGERKGEMIAVNPEMFGGCYVFEFSDGEYTMIPNYAVLGVILKDTKVNEII